MSTGGVKWRSYDPPVTARKRHIATTLYGEEIEADADNVERDRVETSDIVWVLEQDRKFENGNRKVRLSQGIRDPIETEDLFAKWNRTRLR